LIAPSISLGGQFDLESTLNRSIMETNIILFFSAAGMVITFIMGGIIGWIYKQNVDQNTLKRQMNNLHPEFLNGNGSYVNEELLAVRFMDDDDILDDDD